METSMMDGSLNRPRTRRGHVFAFYSAVPQCGKSSAAEALITYLGGTRVKFAGPLKNMLRSLFKDMGMNFGDIKERLEGSLKEAPIEGLGRSARELAVTLGTSWGRGMVSQHIWEDIAMLRILELTQKGTDVYVDDVRFPSEYAELLSTFGVRLTVFDVQRPSASKDVGITRGVTTEGMLATDKMIPLVNDGTLLQWRQRVLDAVVTIQHSWSPLGEQLA